MTTIEQFDPVLGSSEPGRYWSTANTGEATPDILSPLCWSLWGDHLELASRRAFFDFGILPRRELRAPDNPNRRITSCFFGRQAMNIDLLRDLMGAIPGASADDFERDLAGAVRPDVSEPKTSLHRLAPIACKAPVAMVRTGRLLRQLHAEQEAWWRAEVFEHAGAQQPRTQLLEAARRYEAAMHLHVRGRFITQSLQAQVTTLATGAGAPELANAVLSGLGGVAETMIAEDLWSVSRGRLDLHTFLFRHGFHGPNEGNVISRSWREDATAVERIATGLAERPDAERPLAREARAASQREAAVAELIGQLPRHRHSLARQLIRMAGRAVRTTEVGKASFLMAIDGARAAARAMGRNLFDAGQLDDPEDVFFLTIPELAGPLADNAAAVGRFRRDRREEHRRIDLPVTFYGMPTPVEHATPDTDTSDGDVVIAGLGASPGVARGRVRIVLDPANAVPLDPDEVLVCRQTDPSWTPLFMMAAALVIDVGGTASHGAIVARELGVPCVISTGDGTRRLADGAHVSVDGGAGTVTVVANSSVSSPAASAGGCS